MIHGHVSEWFESLQKKICHQIESIEKDFNPDNTGGSFKFKSWERTNEDGTPGGGGVMGIMKEGGVFEKAGVNFSSVYGTFPKAFAKEIPGAEENPYFKATGVSLVIHPKNPHVPIIHMNVRRVTTTKTWFGGGIDMTPSISYDDDTRDFHQHLKMVCDRHNPEYYPQYKKWCDDYFYLPHRKEPRGIGGIFFDYLHSESDEKDWSFVQDVGESILGIYPKIVKRRFLTPWGQVEKEKQKIKRGRYVEFNLIHDRGTRFGLMTNGNTEAILMSLPPEAAWP